MKHKYIRHSELGFVTWPDTDLVWHKDVANLIQKHMQGTIVSAGFFDIFNGEVRCYGQSGSLNIDSLPEDSQALANQLGL